ncbi:MAG: hypothetical protein IKL80_05250 [Clostridia bacterium]|nr:hypothetical protein [Clostridia bacterium]
MKNTEQNENRTFKHKWEDFWYYHKVTVIICIFILVFIAMFISQFTSKIKTDLNISLITADVVTEGSINFDELLSDRIQDTNADGENNITLTRLFITGKEDDEADEASRQNLEAQLANRGSVIFIFDAYNYENAIKKDAFCPLNELIDVESYGDRVVYHNEKPMALSLKGSALLADMGFSNDDLYALVLFRRPEDAQNETLNLQYENAAVVLNELMK